MEGQERISGDTPWERLVLDEIRGCRTDISSLEKKVSKIDNQAHATQAGMRCAEHARLIGILRDDIANVRGERKILAVTLTGLFALITACSGTVEQWARALFTK